MHLSEIWHSKKNDSRLSRTQVHIPQNIPIGSFGRKSKVIDSLIYKNKKRGASSVARSTIRRPSHCPVSRNEQRRKPHVSVSI